MHRVKCPAWSKSTTQPSSKNNKNSRKVQPSGDFEDTGIPGLNQWRSCAAGNSVDVENIVELANGNNTNGNNSQRRAHHARSSASTGTNSGGTETRRERLEKTISVKAEDVVIPLLLHSFLDFMYYAGLTQYKRFQRDEEGATGILKIFDILQKVLYWISTTASILQSLHLTKFCLLDFLDEKGVTKFMDLCFFGFILATKLYSVFMFIFDADGVTRMLEEQERSSIGDKPTLLEIKSRKTKKSKWMHLLGISSVATNFVRVIFGIGITGWSWEALVMNKSVLVEFALYGWTTSDLYNESNDATETNSTIPVTMATLNGTDTNATNISPMSNSTLAMGIAGIIMDICSSVQIDGIRDLITVTSVTLNKHVGNFINRIKDEATMHLEDSFGMKNFAKFEKDWIRYRVLKRAIKATNKAFDILLKLMHVNHLLLFPYFMSVCLGTEEISGVQIIILVFNILKILVTLYIARKTAESNEICRKWIWIWFCEDGQIRVQNFVWTAIVVLDELDKEPLGLGNGHFMIDESFLFRFFGLVGSLFMILAEDRDKSFRYRLRR